MFVSISDLFLAPFWLRNDSGRITKRGLPARPKDDEGRYDNGKRRTVQCRRAGQNGRTADKAHTNQSRTTAEADHRRSGDLKVPFTEACRCALAAFQRVPTDGVSAENQTSRLYERRNGHPWMHPTTNNLPQSVSRSH